jgi:dipeptidase
MFHVLPDDTQTSAIWVAQRVPNDHITAVANQFVIGEIDLSDKANYLGSSNLLAFAGPR